MKKLCLIAVFLSLEQAALMAQPNDSNTITITDIGTGININIGDSNITFSNEGLYYHFIEKGIEYGSKGDYESAISYFSTSLLYIWDNPEAYYYRGLAYSYSENYEKAIEDFNRALSFDSNHYQSLNERGIIFSKNGNYDLGKIDFNKAIAINPEYPESYLNLGITLLIELDYKHGCEFIGKAKDMDNEKAKEIYLNYCN